MSPTHADFFASQKPSVFFSAAFSCPCAASAIDSAAAAASALFIPPPV